MGEPDRQAAVFRTATASYVNAQHKSAPVPLDGFDQPLQGLIAWGMAKSPADRPESARAFVDDLEARAEAAYGENWVEHGRSELGERATALLPSWASKEKAARRRRPGLPGASG